MRTPRKFDGSAIGTYTGRFAWPNNPRSVDINIHDIAHSLALSCRWTGHVRRHYSVGQHSVLASYLVPEQHALAALLHDAAEAYLSDIARPVKPAIAGYKEIEARLQNTIMRTFGLPIGMPKCVKVADTQLLCTEHRDLMRRVSDPQKPLRDIDHAKALPERIRPWPMWWSEFRFLWRFGGLTRTRSATMKQWAKNKLADIWLFDLKPLLPDVELAAADQRAAMTPWPRRPAGMVH